MTATAARYIWPDRLVGSQSECP